MIVEHFNGAKECENLNELELILNERTDKGVNEFILSIEEEFPYMIIAVRDKS